MRHRTAEIGHQPADEAEVRRPAGGAVVALALRWLATQDTALAVPHSGAPGTMAGVVAAAALFGLLAVALGALIRDQVTAVVSLLIHLFVLEPIATNFTALGSWTAHLPGATTD